MYANVYITIDFYRGSSKFISMETIEQRRERQRKNYKNNAENKKAQVKKYKENNSEAIKVKNKAYRKKRKETDPLYKLTESIRRLILNAFKNKGIIKQSRTTDILGCSFDKFKQHIENQFESWMTWNNRGSSTKPKTKWQIDHIIPLAIGKTSEDIIRLNHYTNLRPLCAKENRDKGSNII